MSFERPDALIKTARDMAETRYHFNLLLRPEPGAGFTATVPTLPGCATCGRTLDGARLRTWNMPRLRGQ